MSVTRRTPPWRWTLRGPWPPDGSSRQEATPTEDAIRARADYLAKRRPWCSAEQNWADARLEMNSPFLLRWRPSVLRWLGASEKTGWDWMDFLARLSVPVAIAAGSSFIATQNAFQQLETSKLNQKDAVVSDYILSMKSLILESNLNKAKPKSPASIIARALTLTALSRIGTDDNRTSRHKGEILQFLQEANLIDTKDVNVSLANADLKRANLILANLRDADLSGANLNDSDLSGADLRGANLNYAYLNGANLAEAWLVQAKLNEAVLRGTNLSGTSLVGAKLRNAILAGANLDGSDLSGADLSGAITVGRYLSSTDKRTYFDGSWAILGDADLSKARFCSTIDPDEKMIRPGCKFLSLP
jgi:uncharacterized protein YjbI with pentapeptide repeats